MNDTNLTGVSDSECILALREKNYSRIFSIVGTEEFLYSSYNILMTRVVPVTFTCPFGIILNCLFLYVVFRVRSMHTLTNMYLSNQAIVDCALLTVYYVVTVGGPLASELVFDQGYLGRAGCLLTNLVLDICLFVSEFNITLVTFERYLAICKPFKSDRISSKSRTVKLIIMTWILGFIFSTPIIYFYTDWSTVCVDWIGPANETAHLPTRYVTCRKDIRNPGDGIMMTFPPLMAFMTVLVGIIIMNTLTVRELRRGVKKHAVNVKDLKQRLYQQRQIVAMLAVTAGVFFVCLLPYHLDLLFTFYNTVPGANYILMPSVWVELVRWLPMVNCSVNPIIYGILNKKYRQAFLKTLCCCRRGQNNQDYTMNSTATQTDVIIRSAFRKKKNQAAV
ncbi:growth hormone secretagogue receptor type 1-like [Glandiceps talaboti]